VHLLSLTGEQPIPNLLVARALQPASASLCYTESTRRFAANLVGMLADTEYFPVEPYDLEHAISQISSLCTSQTVINLTGGTKLMALAAYEIARRKKLPFVYLQSEGARSVLHRYRFTSGGPAAVSSTTLGSLITIQDYLQAHGLRQVDEKGPQNEQEQVLRDWLQGQVEELYSNLLFDAFEIDLILRRGNMVAVLEAKMKKKNDRTGIDQLNTITGRDYLGTYTGKILVVSKPLGPQLSRLADARHIQVVLAAGQTNQDPSAMQLNHNSKVQLQIALDQTLGPGRR
jgi:hypothetical protein